MTTELRLIPNRAIAPSAHLYDRPGIGALAFLQAVVNDPRTPMFVRMDTAQWLLKNFPETSRTPTYTVVIGVLSKEDAA
jgi:hypothetical protein